MSSTPQTDAKGREVFTVHPEILSAGTTYRKVAAGGAEQDQAEEPADAPAGSTEQ